VLLQVAAPALSALPAREQTLANVIQLEFPEDPQWVVAAVRCDLHADCVLFGGLASLASAVLRLAKSFIPTKTPAAGSQWASLLLLLDAVLAEVRSPHVPLDAEQREHFRVRVAEAGDLVRAARVFSRHGMHLMACVLTASDRWNDLRDLHAYVFEAQGLSLAYMLREFLRATLLAQQWEVAERCASLPTTRYELCGRVTSPRLLHRCRLRRAQPSAGAPRFSAHAPWTAAAERATGRY